jgi:hypothetical protein
VKGLCTTTGRFRLTVQRHASGRFTVEASAHRLPDGSKWRIALFSGPSRHSNVSHIRGVHRTVRGGAWSAAAHLKPFHHPDVGVFAVGPHDRTCIGFVDPSWPKFALATCHGKKSLSMVARRRPGDRLAVRSQLAGAQPGSAWTVSTSVTTGTAMSSSTEGRTTHVIAGRHGIVHTQSLFAKVPHPQLHVSAVGPKPQRCSTSLRTTQKAP